MSKDQEEHAESLATAALDFFHDRETMVPQSVVVNFDGGLTLNVFVCATLTEQGKADRLSAAINAVAETIIEE